MKVRKFFLNGRLLVYPPEGMVRVDPLNDMEVRVIEMGNVYIKRLMFSIDEGQYYIWTIRLLENIKWEINYIKPSEAADYLENPFGEIL